MNGRVYDYNLGRFLSVDPFIQEPGNSQSMNPYSYIMNNPLAGTDPSGFLIKCTGRINCTKQAEEQEQANETVIITVERKNGKQSTVVTTSGNSRHALEELIGEDKLENISKITFVNLDRIQSMPRTGATDKNGNEKHPLLEFNDNMTQVVKALTQVTASFYQQLLEVLREADTTTDDFARGTIDGVESVPRGIVRLYQITGDMLGLNGEEYAKNFSKRIDLFDMETNKIFEKILKSNGSVADTVGNLGQSLNFFAKHHSLLIKTTQRISAEQKSYMLGRLTGRMTVLSKASAPAALGVKFGDLYFGVVRTNIGIARTVEVALFGDVMEDMGIDPFRRN